MTLGESHEVTQTDSDQIVVELLRLRASKVLNLGTKLGTDAMIGLKCRTLGGG